MPIGVGTSDNGVHVHRNVIPMCAPALPYMAGCLGSCTTASGAPLPLRGMRPWTGATPPLRDASIGIGEGRHVHAHATLPGGVAPDPSIPCGKAVGSPERVAMRHAIRDLSEFST